MYSNLLIKSWRASAKDYGLCNLQWTYASFPLYNVLFRFLTLMHGSFPINLLCVVHQCLALYSCLLLLDCDVMKMFEELHLPCFHSLFSREFSDVSCPRKAHAIDWLHSNQKKIHFSPFSHSSCWRSWCIPTIRTWWISGSFEKMISRDLFWPKSSLSKNWGLISVESATAWSCGIFPF